MSDGNPRERQDTNPTEEQDLEGQRYELLERLDRLLETPMVILAFVWLALLVAEFVWGENVSFTIIGAVIWVIFILDFGTKLILAPNKVAYLKRNWLSAISLLIPALRVLRVFRLFRLLRLARVGRGFRFVRVVSSLNRGMRALGASLQRRGFGYVMALTALIVFGGAAGMYAFEKEISDGLNTYGEAVWWTAMLMTTLGSEYWPQTLEGRVLCVFLALYAFAVFGYVTATLATYFVGRDAANESQPVRSRELAALREELVSLRDEIRSQAGRSPETRGKS